MEWDAPRLLAYAPYPSRCQPFLFPSTVTTMPHLNGHTRSRTAESVPESGPAFDMLGAADIERIWSWNRKATAPTGACVHELFEHQAALTPGRPALASWDGEMTYGELDQASTRLGSYLVKKYGLRVEDIVAFTFEKSLCAVVAMMGGKHQSVSPCLFH